MEANVVSRAIQGPLPALEELRAGRAFVLLEIKADGQVAAAEVILRQTRSDSQDLEVAVFVVYSTDAVGLPPGETIVRRASLARTERASWTLAAIHYY